MRFFYKTIGIVAFFCVSQSAFSAFPDDLYGFKLGDSTDATLNKLKNKYGKIEKLSGDEVSIKCGRGNIPKLTTFIDIGNNTKIKFSVENNTITRIEANIYHPPVTITKASTAERKERKNLFEKFGKPESIKNKNKQDIYFYKNNTAYFYYDYYNTTFVLYDFSYDTKVGKITDNCINKTFQTNLP